MAAMCLTTAGCVEVTGPPVPRPPGPPGYTHLAGTPWGDPKIFLGDVKTGFPEPQILLGDGEARFILPVKGKRFLFLIDADGDASTGWASDASHRGYEFTLLGHYDQFGIRVDDQVGLYDGPLAGHMPKLLGTYRLRSGTQFREVIVPTKDMGSPNLRMQADVLWRNDEEWVHVHAKPFGFQR
jgi:hypothetical protein